MGLSRYQIVPAIISILALICLLMITNSSCAPMRREPLPTRAALERDRGAPVSIEKTVRGQEVLELADGEKYQYDLERPVARIRSPKGLERHLQYWRHRWLKAKTRNDPVPGSEDGHGRVDYQLSAPSLGELVVYRKETGFVYRVVEFDPE